MKRSLIGRVLRGAAFLVLASTPAFGLTLEPLGTPLVSADVDGAFLGHDPSGDRTLFVHYTYNFLTWQLVALDLVTGEIKAAPMTPGRANVQGAWTGGKWIVGSNDWQYLSVYDWASGTETNLGRQIDKTAYSYVVRNGVLWIGCATTGRLEKLDLATDTVTDLGIIDNPEGSVARYVYRLGADDRWIYCFMRDSGLNKWWVVTVDTANGNLQTPLHRNDGHTGDGIYETVAGGTYYAHFTGGADPGYYKCENGGLTFTTSVPPLKSYSEGVNVNNNPLDWLPKYGVSIDLTKQWPDNGPVQYSWSLDGGAQRTAQIAIPTIPEVVKRFVPDPNGTMMGLAQAYGPTFRYDPTTLQATILGRTGSSLYDALFDGRYWWLTGYTAATWRYDPTLPWSATNPVKAHGFGTYHYHVAKDFQGAIYVLVYHERDAVNGSTLGWTDPNNLSLYGSLHTPFQLDATHYYTPRSLVTNAAGTLLGAAENSVGMGDGAVFVIDAATKTVARTIVPLPGSTDPGVIVAAGGGDRVVGVIGSTAYSVDLGTGAVVWRTALPGTAFFGVTTLPDRRLWTDASGSTVFVPLGGTSLYALHASDGSGSVVGTVPAPGLAMRNGAKAYLTAQSTLQRFDVPCVP